MKLKKLGAFAATGAMALALALTGCGSSNATSGSDAGSNSSDDVKVEKVDGSKEYALVKDGTLTVGTSAEYAPFEYKDDNGDYQGFDLELIKVPEVAGCLGPFVGVEPSSSHDAAFGHDRYRAGGRERGIGGSRTAEFDDERAARYHRTCAGRV